MSPTRDNSHNRLVTYLLSIALPITVQFVACVWYAAHLSAQTSQNAKDIAALQIVVVPRTEITQGQQNLKDRLDSIDAKLNIMLEESRKR